MTQKETNNIEILKDAMKKTNIVTFMYKNNLKVVEPYLIGHLFNKDESILAEGKLTLRAWFLSGETSTSVDKREGDRWRLFEINLIDNLSILPNKFNLFKPFYDERDRAFKKILYCFTRNNKA